MKEPPPIEGIESGLEKVESKSGPDTEDKLEDAAVAKSAAETEVLLESAKDKIEKVGLSADYIVGSFSFYQ